MSLLQSLLLTVPALLVGLVAWASWKWIALPAIRNTPPCHNCTLRRMCAEETCNGRPTMCDGATPLFRSHSKLTKYQ